MPSVAIIRSITDFPFPFEYVNSAGGPGYIPLRIYHPCYSHTSKTHFDLVCIVSSRLFLFIHVSPIFGLRLPIREFQSPHTTDWSWGGMDPRMSSIYSLECSSFTFLFARFVAGGKYTLPIHVYYPPGKLMHTHWAYSFPTYFCTRSPFLTNMAIPPLYPFALRSSYT